MHAMSEPTAERTGESDETRSIRLRIPAKP